MPVAGASLARYHDINADATSLDTHYGPPSPQSGRAMARSQRNVQRAVKRTLRRFASYQLPALRSPRCAPVPC
eukprot:598523-Rhodomonas_salina.1